MCKCPSPGPSRQLETGNAIFWLASSLLVLLTDVAYRTPYFIHITQYLVGWCWWAPYAAAGGVLCLAAAEAIALWREDCQGRLGTALPFLFLWGALFGFHLLYTHMLERALLCGLAALGIANLLTSLFLHLEDKIQWRGKHAGLASTHT